MIRPVCAALSLALSAWALSGCTLIDQRTFRSAGALPSEADLARANLPPLPLLTIRFDQPDLDIRPQIEAAVEAATARKPNAEFDVVSPIPTKATPPVQQIFAQLGAKDCATVAEALGYAGVGPDRVHIGYRDDAGSPPREVLVFVR